MHVTMSMLIESKSRHRAKSLMFALANIDLRARRGWGFRLHPQGRRPEDRSAADERKPLFALANYERKARAVVRFSERRAPSDLLLAGRVRF